MMILKRIHFYLGLVIIAHFFITGLLMRQNIFLLEPGDTTVRMMFRANHIYILFSGLINLLISHSYKLENTVNIFHFVVSSTLLLTTIGISGSFYIDPIKHFDMTTHLMQRKFTSYSVIGCFLGTGFHLLLLQFYNRKSDRSSNR